LITFPPHNEDQSAIEFQPFGFGSMPMRSLTADWIRPCLSREMSQRNWMPQGRVARKLLLTNSAPLPKAGLAAQIKDRPEPGIAGSVSEGAHRTQVGRSRGEIAQFKWV
jgi:hypothetical protein